MSDLMSKGEVGVSMSQVEETGSGARHLIISGDSHVGPSLEGQLRDYCPSSHLEAFDEYALQAKKASASFVEKRFKDFATEATLQAVDRSMNAPGLQDPAVFLADMDADGVAASVIYAGGGNNEPLPWIGDLVRLSGDRYSDELAAVGSRIWNQWLADFTSTDSRRLLGVAQIPFTSIDTAIREVQWAHEHGLRALNFPAPRSDLLPYNDLAYEPFWRAVEETGLPLVTHGASGDVPDMSRTRPGYFNVYASEILWMSRRGIPYLIFGGVFERHPSLKLVLTEQRVDWVGEVLRELDSIYSDPNRNDSNKLPRRPSDYWRSNCYITGSFMARYEAAKHEEVGPHNLMWGSDYPHPEGTWPRTNLSLRNTFAAIPESDVRLILGENALPVYGLDRAEMRQIADRIGPTQEEISRPVAEEELPAHRGRAFREFGAFA